MSVELSWPPRKRSRRRRAPLLVAIRKGIRDYVVDGSRPGTEL